MARGENHPFGASGAFPAALRIVPGPLRINPERLRINPELLRIVPELLRIVPERLRIVPELLGIVPEPVFQGFLWIYGKKRASGSPRAPGRAHVRLTSALNAPVFKGVLCYFVTLPINVGAKRACF
jgi:hypothetical protein